MTKRTTTRYVNVNTWGRFGNRSPLGTIRVRIEFGPWTERTGSKAVAASIARRLGLDICGGPRDEGTAIDHGEPTAHHYAATFGRRLPRKIGGGYSPEAEVWFAVPVVNLGA